MITWSTAWFLVVTLNAGMSNASSYAIPYATQEICLKRAAVEKKSKEHKWSSFKCEFGQLPVYKGDKK